MVAIEVPIEPIFAIVCVGVEVFVGTMISQPGSIAELDFALVTVPF